MELIDLLSVLKQDEYITIKTDDIVKPFQIEWLHVEAVARYFPEWSNAFVSGLTTDGEGEYVITIVPED